MTPIVSPVNRVTSVGETTWLAKHSTGRVCAESDPIGVIALRSATSPRSLEPGCILDVKKCGDFCTYQNLMVLSELLDTRSLAEEITSTDFTKSS